MSKYSAVIVTIGDEILIGQILDTNSQWLANNLFSEGFTIAEIISIGDNAEKLIEVLGYVNNRFDFVVFTGGLGPTNDDRTKIILNNWFGAKLVLNHDVLSDISEMHFRRHGNKNLNKRNHDQALVPDCCTVLRNEVGTAPGMVFSKDDSKTTFAILPGVPFEMKWLYENRLKEIINSKFDLIPQTYDLFHVMGISESALAHLLEDWEEQLPDEWKPAYLPAAGIIKLRVFRPQPVTEHYKQSIDTLKNLLGEKLIAKDQDTILDTVAKLLVSNKLTIGTAESCTGGNIARVFTQKAGASDYFKGSIVSYSNEIKTNILKVDEKSIEKFGAVSQEVVEQMSAGAQKILNCDIVVSTTGIAGPSGGTEQKPVGTVWISVYFKGKFFTEKYLFGKTREINIERTTNSAIYLLYKVLKNLYKPLV